MKSLTLLALCFLQNGAIPKFLGEERLNKIFVKEESSNSCYKKLRSDLKAIVIYQVSRYLSYQELYIFSLCIEKLYKLMEKHFSTRYFFRRKLLFLKLLCILTQ